MYCMLCKKEYKKVHIEIIRGIKNYHCPLCGYLIGLEKIKKVEKMSLSMKDTNQKKEDTK